MIGTCGPVPDTGVIEAKRVGFAAIVDLRPPGDASRSEQRRAEYSRLRYFNLPVEGPAPTDDQVRQFAAIASDRGTLPVLLHGANIDQSGAMWALYRASLGVPPQIALGDGETAGLAASREAIRARLGVQAQTAR